MNDAKTRYSGKGPLRKIVRIVHPAGSLFDLDKVELECGHEARSNAIYRARCTECKKQGVEK